MSEIIHRFNMNNASVICVFENTGVEIYIDNDKSVNYVTWVSISDDHINWENHVHSIDYINDDIVDYINKLYKNRIFW